MRSIMINRLIDSGIRALGTLAAKPATHARLPVLIYHRVLAEPDPLLPGEFDLASFRAHMQALVDYFRVLPLDEALALLERGKLPARSACITFDDGYRNNYEIALPLLQEYGVTATFFVATGFLDGESMWNDLVIEGLRETEVDRLDLSRVDLGVHAVSTPHDKRLLLDRLLPTLKYLPAAQRSETVAAILEACAALPVRGLMMTPAQVVGMRDAGMTIGAHTQTHPILLQCDDDTCEREIHGSKVELEALLGDRVNLFAYPNGKLDQDYGARHVDIVRRAGFVAAVTTEWDCAGSRDDIHQIPRLTPWDREPRKAAARLVANCLRSRWD